MILLLIRHGESEADVLNVHEGRADFELTQKGHEQAKKLAEFPVKHYHITEIYSSALKRAKQTALYLYESVFGSERVSQLEINERIFKYPLAKKSVFEENMLNKIIFEEDLMEFNNGLLAGFPRDEALRKYPPIKDLSYDKSVYEMESRLAFRERADKVLHKIMSKEFENITSQKLGYLVSKESESLNFQESKLLNPQDSCIAIVSHGGLIDQMYKVILDLPMDTAFSFRSADTGFHEWKVEKSGISISKCNQLSHL